MEYVRLFHAVELEGGVFFLGVGIDGFWVLAVRLLSEGLVVVIISGGNAEAKPAADVRDVKSRRWVDDGKLDDCY